MSFLEDLGAVHLNQSLEEIKSTLATVVANQGQIMSQQDELRREVGETSTAVTELIEEVANVATRVQAIMDQLPNVAELGEFTAQLDAEQQRLASAKAALQGVGVVPKPPEEPPAEA